MKSFKVDENLNYTEVEATKVTDTRVYFTDSNGRDTYESRTSHHWGYVYFFSEKEAVDYILETVTSRIEHLNYKIGNLQVKGEQMIKLQKSL